jgi:NAD(P)-dependent dehydrogenase (short-subunit alcohol dehydrogenase family)
VVTSIRSFAAWTETPTAVVTGGGSGIGKAIAERLAGEGAKVAVWDSNREAAEATAAGIEADGGEASGLEVDVTDPGRVSAATAEVCDLFGPPLILVNNAGISPFKRFLEIRPEELDEVLSVNLKGTFYCCQAVLPHMLKAAWGRIVNIASSSAQTGSAMQVHYSASKGAVIALTRSLAREFGPKGITVNAIPPSFVDTPALRSAEDAGYLGEGVPFHERSTPVRRVGRPEDIAAACAFLVRNDAGYVTGQVIGVNGGRVS